MVPWCISIAGTVSDAAAAGGWLHWLSATRLTIEHFHFSSSIKFLAHMRGKKTIIYLKMAPHGVWSISVQPNVCRMLELAVLKSGIYANSGGLTLYKHSHPLIHSHYFTPCSRRVKLGDYTTTSKSVVVSTLWLVFVHTLNALLFFSLDRFYRENCAGFLHSPVSSGKGAGGILN